MRLCFFIVICVLFYACKTSSVKEDKVIEVLTPQDLQTELKSALAEFLEHDSLQFNSTKLSCYSYFKTMYQYTPLWFDAETLNSKADSLIKCINNASYFGLYSLEYHTQEFQACFDSIKLSNNRINISALIKADLLLSDAYFLMGAHLNKGRFYPDSLARTIRFKELTPKWDSVLINGYKQNRIKEALTNLEPKHYHYQILKQQLHNIIQTPQIFNFDSVSFNSNTDIELRNKQIIKHLSAQGLYDSLSTQNDSIKLAKALNKLQKQWFIQPDGKLGKYTIMALSYNREKIIKQICMSMERWRWENEQFPKQYAFINIPAFELTLYEADTVVMQSAVVCGKPETQTPILSSKIDHMLIYPYWKVPQSIATKEILPAVKRDTAYLRKKNFEVLGAGGRVLDYTTLPWKKYTEDYLPVTFRQRIGNENSLGIVKFNFHNPYGVYLHDTNSKKYFKTSNRSQSHGCIRLEKFEQFADYLIRDDSLHYTHDSLLLYFSKQEQRKIKLKNRLPIYTRYYTAYADSLGLKLYLDIYRKDEELMKLIYQ